MKKYLFLLVMIVSSLEAQENNHNTQMNFPYINNSLKLYTALGLPTGLGLLYAPELRSSINNNILHVFNFDMKFIGVDVAADTRLGVLNYLLELGFGVGFQYSIGTLLVSGARFYVDLIGVGFHVAVYSRGSYLSINTIGFQSTLSNGFYWAVRTQVNVSKNPIYNHASFGFTGYAALGYDFGKKINPKDYQSRMR